MSVPPQKPMTVEEFISTAVMLKVQKDRIAQSLAFFDNQYAVMPFVVPVFGLNPSGKPISLFNASDELPMTEKNSADIKTGTDHISAVKSGSPLAYTVGGTAVDASNPWLPFAPITRTADAAGNPGAAAEIVAASAGKLIEVMIWAQASAAATSGCYKLRYCQKTGTPGAVAPVWGALVTPIPLGGVFPVSTYGIRLSTTTPGENFGVGTGVNGDYTNNASVTFFGFYRYI